jgi:hypothetical protein
VQKFQLENALIIDGIVGHKTWHKIKQCLLQSKDEKYVNEGKYEASELYHFETLEELIKYFEGKYLNAYNSPFGNFKIGYGHSGPEVHKGMTISEEKCE